MIDFLVRYTPLFNHSKDGKFKFRTFSWKSQKLMGSLLNKCSTCGLTSFIKFPMIIIVCLSMSDMLYTWQFCSEISDDSIQVSHEAGIHRISGLQTSMTSKKSENSFSLFNPQIRRPLSRIIVPLVYFFYIIIS
jgi:hypothetical protein